MPARRELWLRLFAARLIKLLFDLRVLHSFCCSQISLLPLLPVAPASGRLSGGRPARPRAETATLRPERHPQMLQQRPRLVIGSRRRHNGHVHAFQLVNLRVVNLRENQLIMQTQRVIAAAVKRLRRDSAKVTHSRKHDAHQPVKNFVHAMSAPGHRFLEFQFLHQGHGTFLLNPPPQPRPLFRRVTWSLCAGLLSRRLPLVALARFRLLLVFLLSVCSHVRCYLLSRFRLVAFSFYPLAPGSTYTGS